MFRVLHRDRERESVGRGNTNYLGAFLDLFLNSSTENDEILHLIFIWRCVWRFSGEFWVVKRGVRCFSSSFLMDSG